VRRFDERLNDDLDTPGAIAALWESLNSGKLSPGETKYMLESADQSLGLGLTITDDVLQKLLSADETVSLDMLPEEVRNLVAEREAARTTKDWAKSDELRKQIETAGYTVKDTPTGAKIFRQ
jgi:cysteinyl-tRNA synthetase